MRPRGINKLAIGLGLLFSALAFSCGPPVRDTRISVSGGAIPEFTVQGSARLTSFKVFGTAHGDSASKPTTLLWEIDAQEIAQSPSLDELHLLRFGTIPAGFTQRSPQTGPPDIFTENVTFVGVFGFSGAPEMKVPVVIRNGKTIAAGTVTEHRNIPTH